MPPRNCLKGIETPFLDTRSKIVDPADLPRYLHTGNWTAVLGLFDPLTLVQAERIAAHANGGRKILAVVLRGENTLLSPESRAILVAALREVDLVAIGSLADIQSFDVVTDDDEAAERKRSQEFAALVSERQTAGSRT